MNSFGFVGRFSSRSHKTGFDAEAPAAWEPQLNEEHDDYRWCDAAEAADLLHWPEPRELAARLLR